MTGPAWPPVPPLRVFPDHEDRYGGGGRHTARGANGGAIDADDDDADPLRPFVLTGGRTRPGVPGLRVETLLRTRTGALQAPLRFEARRIVEACQFPRSLAEVAVLLALPLGIVRILVADLVAEQLLSCEEPSEVSVALLERIIDRVRAL